MKLGHARVLITGAGGGIGSAAARRLGRAGAAVRLTDIAEGPLTRLTAELREEGIDAEAAVANVADADGRAALTAFAQESRVNVLVNLAGVNPFGLFEEQSSEEIERALRINVLAPMLLCQALLPLLAAAAPAHIVNVGSVFGSIAYPGFTVYSATKFAVRGFSEALRRELAGTRIKVHYLAPRATRTALTTDAIRAMNEELKVGMDSAETVAASIERLLVTERREWVLGVRERVAAKLNGLLPGVVDGILRRQLPTIRRYAALPARVPAMAPAAPRAPSVASHHPMAIPPGDCIPPGLGDSR
ncbi:MAG: SDR family oxidoreductase [Gammaproteobacteria bacterium]|nr:SDR family oxidoreductase [Gammaproteobacteria bacterium]